MKSINKSAKINKEKGEVKVEFSAKNITPYGGFGLFRKFVQKLGVEKALDKVLNADSTKGGYTVGRKIMSLVYVQACGLERPSDTEGMKTIQARAPLADFSRPFR